MHTVHILSDHIIQFIDQVFKEQISDELRYIRVVVSGTGKANILLTNIKSYRIKKRVAELYLKC